MVTMHEPTSTKVGPISTTFNQSWSDIGQIGVDVGRNWGNFGRHRLNSAERQRALNEDCATWRGCCSGAEMRTPARTAHSAEVQPHGDLDGGVGGHDAAAHVTPQEALEVRRLPPRGQRRDEQGHGVACRGAQCAPHTTASEGGWTHRMRHCSTMGCFRIA